MASFSVVNQGTELAFSLEGSAQRIVVKILNSETKEVIKQIPNEDLHAGRHRRHKNAGSLLASEPSAAEWALPRERSSLFVSGNERQ